jgi:hypothetical protein
MNLIFGKKASCAGPLVWILKTGDYFSAVWIFVHISIFSKGIL